MAPGGSERELTRGKFHYYLSYSKCPLIYSIHPSTLFLRYALCSPTSLGYLSPRLTSSGATGRAQRASGRVAGAVPPASDPSAPEATTVVSSVPSLVDSEVPVALPIDPDPPSISRSNSALNSDEQHFSNDPASRGRPKGSTKDKGKGKQVDKSVVRVKEEEMAPMSLSPSPSTGPVRFSSFLRL